MPDRPFNLLVAAVCRRLPAILSYALMSTLLTAQPTAPARDEALWQQALRLHRSAIVIDGHNDITSAMVDDGYELATPSPGKNHTDLPRMQAGGLSAQFFAIYVDGKYATNGGATRRALEMIDVVHAAAERHPQQLVMATTAAEIRRAKEQGRIACLMGVENGIAIENSLATLRNLYRLGARYMTLTHMQANDWADASTAPAKHNGLNDFGREVVREMNRLGMMVDVSHVADKTASDVLDLTKAPIIASHSSARALAAHPRNLPDDLLKRIAANGGVVMANFYPGYIDPRARLVYEQLQGQFDQLRKQYKDDPARARAERMKLLAEHLPPTPLSVLMEHIEHLIKVAGIDHVGLGSDFDGISSVPQEMQDVSQYPNITYELLKRGHSESDVKKVLGENLLRVMAEVERVAQSHGGTTSGNGSTMRLKKP
jgi:membrane dipeptidase